MVKNLSHTLAYSLIALQEMNLAYRFPIIFWNCACLISDSGGDESVDIEETDEDIEVEEYSDDSISSSMDFDSDDSEEDENEDSGSGASTKKKKVKSTNYGKIATAIGKFKTEGIKIDAPDINKSEYTFSPDPDLNLIRHGMSGITKIGEELIKEVIVNRPYTSLEDFLSKVKCTKPQVINLIKSGAFDELCGDRVEVMHQYIDMITEKKKNLTLQNMKMLLDYNLIPDEYDFEKRVYNFNKYLKKNKCDDTYVLDNIAYNFFEKNFDIDLLTPAADNFTISKKVWDKIYTSKMDPIRNYLKANKTELLDTINKRLYDELWNKYCLGTVSKWEMDSVSYYSHSHELTQVKQYLYDCVDFNRLPEEPEISTILTIKGKEVPLFKIHRIMGTVLDKNKDKKFITLLTTNGVVTVKMYGGAFTNYDKQISERGADGKKHVIEKSFFSRGNKIIITGIRRDNLFVAKKYSKTPYHLCELITNINDNGTIEHTGVRAGVEEE